MKEWNNSRWGGLGMSRLRMAEIVAEDIPDGSYVNLGIGMPTLVADVLPTDRDIVLHSENGILGMGPAPTHGEEDWELINAGKDPVTLLPGGCYLNHVDSFGMIRGGHLDLAVLGGFQVSGKGDLANWSSGEKIAAVGGAMDLAVGARRVHVMMSHVTRDGRAKVVDSCSYPLTAAGVVRRIYTDIAVIEIEADGAHLLAVVEGISVDEVQEHTGIDLKVAAALKILSGPKSGRMDTREASARGRQ